jgi:hypothetical protein
MTEVQEAVVETADTTNDQRPERAVAVRRFETQLQTGDGRTISFRIAPFGEIATSADGLGGLPRGVPYQEELMPGLYDKQLRAANRVFLNFEHGQGLSNIVGHGVELERRSDGYHGSFRIHRDQLGDKALLLVDEGVLRGASVESYWLKSVRSAAGVVQRVKAHLEAVAICREGAYPSAVMTGLRSGELIDEIVLDDELLPVNPDPDVLARCRASGVRVPQRYEAHPDVTDTPADAGTSEDGTRPDQAKAVRRNEMSTTTQSEIRLASMLDERETVTNLHEAVVASVQTNEDKLPTEAQQQMIRGYREKEIALDGEIETLTEDIERNRRAIESSKAVRRVLVGQTIDGVEMDGETVAYRTMAAYARDVILTSQFQTAGMIAGQVGASEVETAKERLQLAKRTPANTLSSNVGGLTPPQHINQIFQVIDKSRNLVSAAVKATLERGTLTYPQVDTPPVVAVQASQKTEAGNTGMAISMVTATASTYLGGGDLSWQAINWSTPNALGCGSTSSRRTTR